MRGVVGRFHPARQHRVVARTLAFLAQARARDPQQGVEPVHGAQYLRDHLGGPVATADVRDLVPEDDPDAIARPVGRTGGQDDLRSCEPPGHQEGRMVALKQ